jgi:hypothetical protein
VLDELLDRPGEPFTTLRDQLAHASVAAREFTGVGFFTRFSISTDAPVRRDLPSTELGDVGARIAGLEHGAGFVLFVRDGVISQLEGYTYGDTPWPDSTTEFSVVCDVTDLTKRWSEPPTGVKIYFR